MVVLPAPVAPTKATFWPGLAYREMSWSTGLPGTYSKSTSNSRTSPASLV